MLADYFRQLGVEMQIVRNNVTLEELDKIPFKGLVLSPGPETPDKAGNLMLIMEKYHQKVPILGICLGHQAIGMFFGASLVKGHVPVHGKVHEVYQIHSHSVLENIPSQFHVTRYHSLKLEHLPDCLQPLLETASGENMAIAHKTLPIVGIQYHPEAHLTEYGLLILRNWLNLVMNKPFREGVFGIINA
jgi:anthranilate synthase component II